MSGTGWDAREVGKKLLQLRQLSCAHVPGHLSLGTQREIPLKLLYTSPPARKMQARESLPRKISTQWPPQHGGNCDIAGCPMVGAREPKQMSLHLLGIFVSAPVASGRNGSLISAADDGNWGIMEISSVCCFLALLTVGLLFKNIQIFFSLFPRNTKIEIFRYEYFKFLRNVLRQGVT